MGFQAEDPPLDTATSAELEWPRFALSMQIAASTFNDYAGDRRIGDYPLTIFQPPGCYPMPTNRKHKDCWRPICR